MLVRKKSDFGRLVSKPESQVEEFNFDDQDDAIPLQEQLDAITVKIQLKELYNRVLKDELEESTVGAHSILNDLYAETESLRNDLTQAIGAEKLAVQKALRAHRDFQLAMTDRTGQIAIPWLDDKLFDISRRLNLYIHGLAQKRKKLETTEAMVDEIERWPRPGTLPWEMKAVAGFHKYESLREKMKIKLETANILHNKYEDIESVLHEERGKYYPIISTIEDQSKIFKKELADLEKTLNEAISFRDSAVRNLVVTQKEASENRRHRRLQMVKMKTAVRKVLESSANLAAAGRTRREFETARSSFQATGIGPKAFAEIIRFKRAEIEKFQDRARKLVETMRVPNLTHIPLRFQSVMSLGERLRLELASKEDMMNALIHQKGQLYILLAHFSYTGHSVTKEFESRAIQFTHAIQGTNDETKKLDEELASVGDTVVSMRLGTLRILEQLERLKVAHHLKPNANNTLHLIKDNVQKLVEKNSKLKGELKKQEAQRNYALFVKEPPLPPRLYRVGSAGSAGADSGDSDADEDIIDLKVPGRLDIKARSLRFIQHAKIRKGLR